MIRLVRLSKGDRERLFDMMDEWMASGEKVFPYSIRKNDYRDFERYLDELDVREGDAGGLVPDSTFFALDTDTDRSTSGIGSTNTCSAMAGTSATACARPAAARESARK